MTLDRKHWWWIAGLVAVGLFIYWHQSCPGCQGRWQSVIMRLTGAAGAREPGGGQRLGDVPQYVVSPN